MPTENQSSNEQKVVSVPFKRENRYIVIKRKDLALLSPIDHDLVLSNLQFIDSILCGWDVPKRECLVLESDWPEYEPAWASIEARMTGKAVEQPQAEPVGYAAFRDGRYGSWLHPTREQSEMVDALDGGPANSKIVPVYDHADSGEVERLRRELQTVMDSDLKWQGLREQEAEIERLRDKHCNLANLYGKQRLELEAMRSRLAEREALLDRLRTRLIAKGVLGEFGPELFQILNIEAPERAALSASAEPSAPKCSTCQDHGDVHSGKMADQGYNQPPEPIMVAFPDCKWDAPVERDEHAEFEKWWHSTKAGERSPFAAASSAWEARAALERKP